MPMKNKKGIIWVVIIIFVLVGLFAYPKIGPKSHKLDQFAICLKDRGAVFYGAFWCPHCQNQKTLFGGSAELLPYVECSTPDGKGQLDICIEKKIQGYPTWVFSDGTRESGELTLERLAEKTACVLSQ